jgi:hypothetical protein
VSRADIPQQRWEPQRGYTAIRNYSRSPSRSRGRVPIPEWVYEIDAQRPGHFASAIGERARVTVDSAVPVDIGTSTGKREAGEKRRDSATPTHAELFFSEEGSLAQPGMGMGYESRSDAYRNINIRESTMGSAFSSLSPQIRKEERNTNAGKPRVDCYTPTELYHRDTNTAAPQPREEKKTTTLRRLSLRLTASPPLSEDMFDAITGELDVEDVFGEVTANMLEERDIEEVSVDGYLERDGGVVVEMEKGKEEEGEDDFGWIRSAIRRC